MEGVVDYFGFPNFEDEDRVVHAGQTAKNLLESRADLPLSLDTMAFCLGDDRPGQPTTHFQRPAGAYTESTLEFMSYRPVGLI